MAACKAGKSAIEKDSEAFAEMAEELQNNVTKGITKGKQERKHCTKLAPDENEQCLGGAKVLTHKPALRERQIRGRNSEAET